MADAMWRVENAAKARAQRTLLKRRRWAEELRKAGWKVIEPESEKESQE